MLDDKYCYIDCIGYSCENEKTRFLIAARGEYLVEDDKNYWSPYAIGGLVGDAINRSFVERVEILSKNEIEEIISMIVLLGNGKKNPNQDVLISELVMYHRAYKLCDDGYKIFQVEFFIEDEENLFNAFDEVKSDKNIILIDYVRFGGR